MHYFRQTSSNLDLKDESDFSSTSLFFLSFYTESFKTYTKTECRILNKTRKSSMRGL